MQRDNVAFSAYNTDTEDYYADVPSDESLSDEENAPALPVTICNGDSMEKLTAAFASESSIGSLSSQVLTRIGSLNGSKTTQKETKITQEEVKTEGNFHVGGGDKLKVSSQALRLHHGRKSDLQDALDAATGDRNMNGEAPFRFAMQPLQVVNLGDQMNSEELGASPVPRVNRVEDRAPEKNNWGRRRPIVADREESDEEKKDDMMELDPLYDEQLDDVDEQWVQMNLSGAHTTKSKMDAMLCCPCCFVTVCMACKRHATYANQYRATAVVNCRVKRDEILAYASSRMPASLPFYKRQNRNTGSAHKTTSQQIANLLQADEFYAVVCSDCDTIVGVFDRDQQYHFFNALPSNC